ncbi:hypothetical protein N656DRAFT_54295 [Canariomyces notabilis]|uniref:Uncharacterized protein n=1 Tax=Canariomyces notabilis TaxID=2074819 RepID=A0AAN6TNB3_9PEZI|nr:hypothetical protein N656DRAFT_54295 [Canariomyces arenarius]
MLDNCTPAGPWWPGDSGRPYTSHLLIPVHSKRPSTRDARSRCYCEFPSIKLDQFTGCATHIPDLPLLSWQTPRVPCERSYEQCSFLAPWAGSRCPEFEELRFSKGYDIGRSCVWADPALRRQCATIRRTGHHRPTALPHWIAPAPRLLCLPVRGQKQHSGEAQHTLASHRQRRFCLLLSCTDRTNQAAARCDVPN